MRKKIGECLIQSGLITEDDLRNALAEHKRTGERLGVVLVRMNLATEKQIAKALAMQLGFPYVNLGENPVDPTAVVLVPKENVKDLQEIPEEVKNAIEIVPVQWFDEVLERALERKPEPLVDAPATPLPLAPEARPVVTKH